MKAVILAAGRGSRMQELTDDQPKCLVKFRGKSLLEWQLQALRAAGISEIAIVTGYLRETLANQNLVEFFNPRWASTNMVSSLSCAREWLAAEPCLVSYSDIFYGADAAKALMECIAPLAVLYDPNWRSLWEKRFGDPLLDAESFRMNSDGRIVDIGAAPNSVEEIQGQYMGLLRFTPQSWEEIERLRATLTADQNDKMHMTGTLQMLIENQSTPITAVPYEGEWGEIDSATDIDAYL